jgi:hypothetical protein
MGTKFCCNEDRSEQLPSKEDENNNDDNDKNINENDNNKIMKIMRIIYLYHYITTILIQIKTMLNKKICVINQNQII